MSEESRAALWRRQQSNRRAAERARARALQAPAANARAVRDAWAPLILANRERGAAGGTVTNPAVDP